MGTKRVQMTRIPFELQQIESNYQNHGISCEIIDTTSGQYGELRAGINGPKDSPYEKGRFIIQIKMGDHYPFRPPTFKFTTPVFHPNIDNSGNICLDLLRMPPAGTYNPAVSLESILLSIQLLLATPNPDDPLNGEAADLFRNNKKAFEERAQSHTQAHASQKDGC